MHLRAQREQNSSRADARKYRRGFDRREQFGNRSRVNQTLSVFRRTRRDLHFKLGRVRVLFAVPRESLPTTTTTNTTKVKELPKTPSP
ncbi:hypothetical protein AVEN_16588-1 [Araneus ventricosus]|uniref:Uncharacterized protein n=1 Tax=Araneus ventricosus TaxID=182803 RepID=A0A4Y2JRL2_ARAVE|nr:hypothetical protein AVEN_16588-1 [Araneus ventricosus]